MELSDKYIFTKIYISSGYHVGNNNKNFWENNKHINENNEGVSSIKHWTQINGRGLIQNCLYKSWSRWASSIPVSEIEQKNKLVKYW